MLSKFIYRFVAVVLLALFVQVGYSQSYVDYDVAIDRLELEISDLQTEIDGPGYTGFYQFQADLSNEKISLQLMKTVKEEIATEKAVKPIMDAWYEAANAESAERKTKLILALDKVKELLS